MTHVPEPSLSHLMPGPPEPRPGRWILPSVVGLVGLTGAALLLAWGIGRDPASTGATSPTTVPVATTAAAAVGDAAGPTTPAPTTPAAVQRVAGAKPWTPCSRGEGPNECLIDDDSCDWIHWLSLDGGLASVVESFRNRDINEKRLNDCPAVKRVWQEARRTIPDGSWIVGKDVIPGRYQTAGQVRDCYWERRGNNGEILDNNFVIAASKLTVTIRAGDDTFTTRDCGNWIRIG